MKLSGTLSWNSRPLTSTKSPTVAVPARMELVVRYIMEVRPTEKMKDWPKFRRDRDDVVFRAFISYCRGWVGDKVGRARERECV